MPHASIRLLAGVDQNRTLALNEAAISTSQLIRFLPDRTGAGLVQKYGGWQKFFPNTIGSTIKALWAWADTNITNWLAVGATGSLDVISNGSLSDITPRATTDNVVVDASTVSGSATVTIVDTGSNITSYDSVFIQTQIAVGGLVLFGVYPTTAIGANSYSIQATDALGNPALATATVNNAGAVPTFTTTSGSALVSVTLAAHGLVVGDTFTVLVSTTVGGIVIYGNYSVASVTNANSFVIQGSSAATSSAGPTGMNAGLARYLYYIGYGPPATGAGYGVGGYGTGGYGSGVTPAANNGTAITATDWTLANWGGTLVANPQGDAIYVWDPLTNNDNASVIPEAPTANNGVFVAMPQRQIVAWGSTFTGIVDPLLVRWCDVENYRVWIGQPGNQAGSYRLPRGSKIVGGFQLPQQGLLWTDLALWAMRYVNSEDVYSFTEIGTGCGLIDHKAMASLNGTVCWMGQKQFFRYTSEGVSQLPCPIWDVVFQQLDTNYTENIRAAPNAQFNEVTWFYPVTGSNGVPTNYVKVNLALGQWDYGTLARTAWIDQSVLGPPIGAGSDQYIYQHETTNDADGVPMTATFRTGYLALSEGNDMVFIDQFWPDMKWGFFGGAQSANVQVTFYVANYPGDTPVAHGPYTLTQATEYITPRFRGRLMALEFGSSDIGSFWRLGTPRYRWQPDGRF